MSVVLLIPLVATILAALVLLVAMFVKDKPELGAIGLGLMAGPATVLTLLHVALFQG